MADRPTGAFFGVTPEEFEGPFASELDPRTAQARAAQPTQIPAPGGRISPFAAVAAITSKFLEGATAGRKESYARQEDEKAARLGALNSYVQTVMADPNVSDEAKQQVSQRYFRAIGAAGMEVAGKGGKGGKGQQEGMAGHVGNLMKDLFQGMTGGKMPKGGPDVGNTMADIQHLLYGQDGKLREDFSTSAQREKLGSTISEKLKTVDSAEGAAQVIAENYPQILKAYGSNAKEFINNVVSGYPQLGTPAYYDQAFTKSLATPPGTEAPQGPPRLTPTQLSMAEMAKRVIDKGDIEFTGPDKKKVQRYAQYVETPRGSFWYTQDDQGNPQPVLADDVRKSSTSSTSTRESYGKPQRGSDLPNDAEIRGGGKVDPDKVYVRITAGSDEGKFDAIIPPRTEARKGDAIMGNQIPKGTLDVFGRPIDPGQLYIPTLDSSGRPHGYINKAVQNEYKLYVDPETQQVSAVAIARYPNQATPAPPGTPPTAPDAVPGETKAKARTTGDAAVKQIEQSTGRKLTGEQRTAVSANPFRKPAESPKEEKPKAAGPPGSIPLGGKTQALGAQESRLLRQTDDALLMVKQFEDLLDTKNPDTGKPFRDEGSGDWIEQLGSKAGRIKSWAKYKLGFKAKDSLLSQANSFIALDEIVGSSPYLQGTQAQQVWAAIRQHLPAPTDVPAQMYDKLQQMKNLLPEFRRTLLDVARTRRMGGQIIGPAVNPPPGAATPPADSIGASPF